MPEQPPLEDFFSGRAFDLVMRGYARNQVDDYLTQLEASVRQLHEQNVELRQALDASQQKATEQDKPTYTGLGSRVEQLLRLAEEESVDLVKRARTEAEQLREQIVGKAKREAEESSKRLARQEAELASETKRRREELDREIEERHKASVAEAEQRRRAAIEDADKRIAEATEKAAQLVRVAEEDANRTRSEADAYASGVRGEIEHQLAELEQRKNAVNAQMAQLRNLLGVATPVELDETEAEQEQPGRPGAERPRNGTLEHGEDHRARSGRHR